MSGAQGAGAPGGAGRGRGRRVVPVPDPKAATPPQEVIDNAAAVGLPASRRGRGRGVIQVPARESPGASGASAQGQPGLPRLGGGQGAPAQPTPPPQKQQATAVQPVQPIADQQQVEEAGADPSAVLGAMNLGRGGAGVQGRGRGRGRGDLIAEGGQHPPSVSTGSSGATETTHFSGEPKQAVPPVLPVAQRGSSGPETTNTQPPPRPFKPMRGDRGIQVLVTTNFLRMSVAEQMGIFEYHVDFEPQFDLIASCKKIVYKLQEELGPVRIFDGAKLCLPKKLPDEITVFEGVDPFDPAVKVKVIVKYVKKTPLEECVKFYNVLLRRVLEMTNLKEINKNFFDAEHTHNMPEHKLEIWRGYDTAIDKYDGGLMVCVETLHRVLRNTTVLEYLQSLRNTKPDWKERFSEAVIGRSVLTRYNNKFYRIDDIDWTTNPTHTFNLKKSGQDITFINYFLKHHNAAVTDKTQPMLISRIKPRRNDPTGETKTVLLVPELSYMTGLTEEITSNFNIMKDLISKTRINPVDRLQHLNEFIERVTNCEEGQRLLASWGLSLNPEPVRVEAREIEGPGIRFNERTVRQSPDDNAFARQATSAPCFRPVGYKRWMVFAPQQEAEKAKRMIEMMKAVVDQLGIQYTAPLVITVKGSGRFLNGNDYAKCLRESAQEDQVQFVVVIMSQQRDELYSAVKKQCLVNNSIPSQVILSKTLSNEKRMRSIMQKVVLQINCKLGGALWGLEIPKSLKIMFVGIDAYHDPKRKNKSVLAMVAGMDNECSEHFSKMAFHSAAHQEGSAVFGPLFEQCLKAYCENQRCLPSRVIVFRDGVGDGQMRELEVQEIEPIRLILKHYYPVKEMPKFSFIVVQKRINERMYKPAGGRNMDNPRQGTVIDHTITRFHKYDFFLISQLVRQGTVGPTHYTVLEDSNEEKPDLLQKFAYALTFMYYNWPGTIRVPAVCQYAHKLAYLVGQHLMAAPKSNSDTKLFYL